MITSLVAKDLKRDEGWKPHAYRDHLGWLTIGYGFMVDERRGGQLPRHVAEIWLAWEIERRWEQLTEVLTWLTDQPEGVKRALANMAFQLGVQGVLTFRRMLAALESGDRETAARESLDSKWATQTPERAQRVAALIRGDGE